MNPHSVFQFLSQLNPPKVLAQDAPAIDFNHLNTSLGVSKFTPNANIIGQILGGGSGSKATYGIVPIVILFSGLLLLIFIVFGGVIMLTNPTDPKAQEQGKNMITSAIVGFALLFTSYWIMQILEVIFKLDIV